SARDSASRPAEHLASDHRTADAAGDEAGGAAGVAADLMPVIGAAIIMMAMTRVGRDFKGGRGRRGKRRRGNDPGNSSHVLVPSYFAGSTSLAKHVSKRNPVTP